NDIEAAVLSESRRRCAVCFGLHADLTPKNGQIAHLDKDPSNNARANLMFLCLEHHDEYDSRTSQSKSLTERELRDYYRQLIEELDRHWSKAPLQVQVPGGATVVVNVRSNGGPGGSSVFGGGGGGGGAIGGAGGSGGEASADHKCTD